MLTVLGVGLGLCWDWDWIGRVDHRLVHLRDVEDSTQETFEACDYESASLR